MLRQAGLASMVFLPAKSYRHGGMTLVCPTSK